MTELVVLFSASEIGRLILFSVERGSFGCGHASVVVVVVGELVCELDLGHC